MSRILMTVPPLIGHLNPSLAVADALRRDGHEVAWAAHTPLTDKLPFDARLYPLDSGGDDAPAMDHAFARGLESVRLFFEDYAMPMARRALAPLEAAARAFRPDVMVVDHQMPAGALVARKLDLPWVTLVTTSASILKKSPAFDGWVAGQLLELQRGYLPDDSCVERPDFSPEQVVVFSIEALLGCELPRFEAPYSFVGPAGAGGRRAVDFPWDWLREDRRKILVTLGTVSRDHDLRFFEVMLAALAELPQVQAVVVGPEELAARAPDNVLVRPCIPQLDVLALMDGVVCHAGHNTVCEALRQGLPLIVSPIRDDQPVIAQQVIAAGAGIFLRHGKVTPATVRTAIGRLLNDPLLVENARMLAAQLHAAEGAAGAAERIAALAPTTSLARVA